MTKFTITIPAGKDFCPCCNPACPELDEDGCAYTCYFCCDTGWVAKDVAAAYWQAQTDNVEYGNLRPVVNGKHIVQRCDEYEAWEETRTLLPAAVFKNAARVDAAYAARKKAMAEFMADCNDDIPF